MTGFFQVAVLALLLSPLIEAAGAKPGPLERWAYGAVDAGFKVAAASSLLLLLVQLVVVLLRSVFSVSLIWLQESTLYLFGAMFMLSSAALLLRNGHVRVDIFYAKLPETKQRFVDLFGMLVFVIPMCVLIILVSWDYVLVSWLQMERSQEPSGIHAVFLLKSLIPAFAGLLILAADIKVIESVRALRGQSHG